VKLLQQALHQWRDKKERKEVELSAYCCGMRAPQSETSSLYSKKTQERRAAVWRYGYHSYACSKTARLLWK